MTGLEANELKWLLRPSSTGHRRVGEAVMSEKIQPETIITPPSRSRKGLLSSPWLIVPRGRVVVDENFAEGWGS